MPSRVGFSHQFPPDFDAGVWNINFGRGISGRSLVQRTGSRQRASSASDNGVPSRRHQKRWSDCCASEGRQRRQESTAIRSPLPVGSRSRRGHDSDLQLRRPASNLPRSSMANRSCPINLANECLRRFGKEVLESLVNKQLIWQECQKQGIKITEQDVEDEVERMAAKFGLSTERWLTMLREERDIAPDQYRREIIWPTIALRRLASSKIEVTEEELRKAFESEFGPQVKVRMIALLDATDAAQVQKEAAAHPEKFPDLAKQHSKDPNSAASRGVIPPIRKHLGEPELERVAFGLKVGEVSPVIEVANQFLILKCEQQIKETLISSQDLPKYEQRLHDQIRDSKLRDAAAKLFQTLQDQAQVVNVYNDPKLSQQMPGVAATINNGPIAMKQLADECLARHGKDVLEGEINRKLLEQELRRRNKQVTQPAIDEEIARAAESYGFPNVEDWLKSVTETEHMSVDLYVRDMVWPSVALKTIVGDNIQVTQEDLDKGFASNYGERVEVLAIVLTNQRQANQVWDMARNNPTEQFFGELARQYSVEPFRARMTARCRRFAVWRPAGRGRRSVSLEAW